MLKLIDGLWILFVLGLLFLCLIPYMDLRFWLIVGGIGSVGILFLCVRPPQDPYREQHEAQEAPEDNIKR